MGLQTEGIFSTKMQTEKRQQRWDDFFRLVENSYTSTKDIEQSEIEEVYGKCEYISDEKVDAFNTSKRIKSNKQIVRFKRRFRKRKWNRNIMKNWTILNKKIPTNICNIFFDDSEPIDSIKQSINTIKLFSETSCTSENGLSNKQSSQEVAETSSETESQNINTAIESISTENRNRTYKYFHEIEDDFENRLEISREKCRKINLISKSNNKVRSKLKSKQFIQVVEHTLGTNKCINNNEVDKYSIKEINIVGEKPTKNSKVSVEDNIINKNKESTDETINKIEKKLKYKQLNKTKSKAEIPRENSKLFFKHEQTKDNIKNNETEIFNYEKNSEEKINSDADEDIFKITEHVLCFKMKSKAEIPKENSKLSLKDHITNKLKHEQTKEQIKNETEICKHKYINMNTEAKMNSDTDGNIFEITEHVPCFKTKRRAEISKENSKLSLKDHIENELKQEQTKERNENETEICKYEQNSEANIKSDTDDIFEIPEHVPCFKMNIKAVKPEENSKLSVIHHIENKIKHEPTKEKIEINETEICKYEKNSEAKINSDTDEDIFEITRYVSCFKMNIDAEKQTESSKLSVKKNIFKTNKNDLKRKQSIKKIGKNDETINKECSTNNKQKINCSEIKKNLPNKIKVEKLTKHESSSTDISDKLNGVSVKLQNKHKNYDLNDSCIQKTKKRKNYYFNDSSAQTTKKRKITAFDEYIQQENNEKSNNTKTNKYYINVTDTHLSRINNVTVITDDLDEFLL